MTYEDTVYLKGQSSAIIHGERVKIEVGIGTRNRTHKLFPLQVLKCLYFQEGLPENWVGNSFPEGGPINQALSRLLRITKGSGNALLIEHREGLHVSFSAFSLVPANVIECLLGNRFSNSER